MCIYELIEYTCAHKPTIIYMNELCTCNEVILHAQAPTQRRPECLGLAREPGLIFKWQRDNESKDPEERVSDTKTSRFQESNAHGEG